MQEKDAEIVAQCLREMGNCEIIIDYHTEHPDGAYLRIPKDFDQYNDIPRGGAPFAYLNGTSFTCCRSCCESLYESTCFDISDPNSFEKIMPLLKKCLQRKVCRYSLTG
jgi:hypothetical protein